MSFTPDAPHAWLSSVTVSKDATAEAPRHAVSVFLKRELPPAKLYRKTDELIGYRAVFEERRLKNDSLICRATGVERDAFYADDPNLMHCVVFDAGPGSHIRTILGHIGLPDDIRYAVGAELVAQRAR